MQRAHEAPHQNGDAQRALAEAVRNDRLGAAIIVCGDAFPRRLSREKMLELQRQFKLCHQSARYKPPSSKPSSGGDVNGRPATASRTASGRSVAIRRLIT